MARRLLLPRRRLRKADAGAVGAVAIGLTGWHSGALDPLRQVHPVLLTAGILGASLAPSIATSLATRYGLQAVGYYLAGAALISLLALLPMRSRMHGEESSPVGAEAALS